MKPSDIIKAGLAENQRELNTAMQDAAHYERLKAAAANVIKLRKIAQDQTAALNKALADEAKEAGAAEKAKLADRYRDLRIETIVSKDEPNDNALRCKYIVRYERDVWDSNARDNLPKSFENDNIMDMDDDFYVYIINYKPNALPPKIAALAPGDPSAALNRYALGRSRGYV